MKIRKSLLVKVCYNYELCWEKQFCWFYLGYWTMELQYLTQVIETKIWVNTDIQELLLKLDVRQVTVEDRVSPFYANGHLLSTAAVARRLVDGHGTVISSDSLLGRLGEIWRPILLPLSPFWLQITVYHAWKLREPMSVGICIDVFSLQVIPLWDIYWSPSTLLESDDNSISLQE